MRSLRETLDALIACASAQPPSDAPLWQCNFNLAPTRHAAFIFSAPIGRMLVARAAIARPQPSLPRAALVTVRAERDGASSEAKDWRRSQKDKDLEMPALTRHSLPTQACPPPLALLCLASFAAGSVIGPLCDGLHSSNDVLHYASPVFVPLLGSRLETAPWVPPLFGLAATVLCASHVFADRALAGRPGCSPRLGHAPAAAWVVVGIASFVAQYGASGALAAPLQGANLPGTGLPALDALLAVWGAWAACLDLTSALVMTRSPMYHMPTLCAHAALFQWAVFDATLQGFAWACATALLGPIVEITLIQGLHAYSYTHPDVLGVPTWIPWVYFCGAPANANLGRVIAASLTRLTPGKARMMGRRHDE